MSRYYVLNSEGRVIEIRFDLYGQYYIDSPQGLKKGISEQEYNCIPAGCRRRRI
jgi:hypothetical protein